jgi:hypothetical protein
MSTSAKRPVLTTKELSHACLRAGRCFTDVRGGCCLPLSSKQLLLRSWSGAADLPPNRSKPFRLSAETIPASTQTRHRERQRNVSNRRADPGGSDLVQRATLGSTSSRWPCTRAACQSGQASSPGHRCQGHCQRRDHGVYRGGSIRVHIAEINALTGAAGAPWDVNAEVSAWIFNPARSPDGRRFVYTVHRSDEHPLELYMRDERTSEEEKGR